MNVWKLLILIFRVTPFSLRPLCAAVKFGSGFSKHHFNGEGERVRSKTVIRNQIFLNNYGNIEPY